MKDSDAEGIQGPRGVLPDNVKIIEPAVDKIVAEPTSEQREPAVIAAPLPPADDAAAYPPQDAYQQSSYEQQQPVAF